MTKRHASLLRRFGAICYDALLIFGLLCMTTIVFLIVRGGESVDPADRTFQLALLLVTFGFLTYFWSHGGQTIGIRAWRMRLETADGRPPSFASASLRFAVAVLSWLPLGLGFFWQLWDKDRLTWHDRASGTFLMHYPRE